LARFFAQSVKVASLAGDKFESPAAGQPDQEEFVEPPMGPCNRFAPSRIRLAQARRLRL
jgi:hypothetical protein